MNDSNGTGPGSNARLLELVGDGNRPSAVLWSLLVSPNGSVVYLGGKGDTEPVLLLKAEITWQAGQWHSVVLNYGPKETTLFLDGQLAGALDEGGQALMSGASFGPNDLWLEIFQATNNAPLILHNTTNGVRYQLLSRPEAARPPWLVEQTLFGAPGTNTPTTVSFNERPILFFWAGVDSDGDGLIDYLETANGTNPQNQDSDFDGVNDYVEQFASVFSFSTPHWASEKT